MRTVVTLTVAAAVALAPLSARADGDPDDLDLPSNAIVGVLLVSELFIPDVRIQLRDDERLVLSWPVHLFHLRQTASVELTPFIEPQYQTSTGDGRMVVGARLAAKPGPIGGLIEGGAILGHDAGNGGVVGVGVIVLGSGPTPSLAVVGRATFLPDGERRYDLALDMNVLTLEKIIRILRD